VKQIQTLTLAGALAVSAAVLGGTASYADGQMKVAMITHGQPGDSFWDIIRKGAEAAAKKDNIQLIYYADPTATKEAQLISNAVQQHVDGIAVTLAFPDAEAAAIKEAQAAGIPIVGFNAGADDWKKLGISMYVGQDEVIAGAAVGDKLNAEGSKSAICVDQQQGAVQLEERCDGIKKTFKGALYVLYVNGYDMASAKARITAKLQQSPDVGTQELSARSGKRIEVRGCEGGHVIFSTISMRFDAMAASLEVRLAKLLGQLLRETEGDRESVRRPDRQNAKIVGR